MTPPAPVQQIAHLMLDAKLTLDMSLNEMEKALILSALERNGGNVCHSARVLGVHRNTLARRMDFFDLQNHAVELRLHRRERLEADA